MSAPPAPARKSAMKPASGGKSTKVHDGASAVEAVQCRWRGFQCRRDHGLQIVELNNIGAYHLVIPGRAMPNVLVRISRFSRSRRVGDAGVSRNTPVMRPAQFVSSNRGKKDSAEYGSGVMLMWDHVGPRPRLVIEVCDQSQSGDDVVLAIGRCRLEKTRGTIKLKLDLTAEGMLSVKTKALLGAMEAFHAAEEPPPPEPESAKSVSFAAGRFKTLGGGNTADSMPHAADAASGANDHQAPSTAEHHNVGIDLSFDYEIFSNQFDRQQKKLARRSEMTEAQLLAHVRAMIERDFNAGLVVMLGPAGPLKTRLTARLAARTKGSVVSLAHLFKRVSTLPLGVPAKELAPMERAMRNAFSKVITRVLSHSCLPPPYALPLPPTTLALSHCLPPPCALPLVPPTTLRSPTASHHPALSRLSHPSPPLTAGRAASHQVDQRVGAAIVHRHARPAAARRPPPHGVAAPSHRLWTDEE